MTHEALLASVAGKDARACLESIMEPADAVKESIKAAQSQQKT